MIQENDFKSKLTTMFKLGMTKRELISRVNDKIYLLIENDSGNPAGFHVLLMDDRAEDKEFVLVGRNLNEDESLKLALNFATHCNLFRGGTK
ncbi:MAG: hypothetical protein E7253_04535 [Lachnospiraceae bacterium]|nr:hypothetical protein [Lachnospiraceae bacterium]